MKISDLLTPDHVVYELRGSDKPRLLEELARRLSGPAGVDAKVIADALKARETLGSTGMGAGIAIPHARLPAISAPIGLFARLMHTVEYDAIDGQRVDLVFLLLLPAEAQGDHLNALACVARRLRDSKVTAALRRSMGAHRLYAILTTDSEGQPSATPVSVARPS